MNSLKSSVLLKTPVLFLIFNRPDTTQRVFNSIREAKPQMLFVASDGPRPNHPEDEAKVNKSRNIINQIDWPCSLKTLFRDTNLGCKNAVSSSISWFFEHVEQGIILEDDCLPSKSFFSFCETLLDKYKNDERIGQISGFNGLGSYQVSSYSYHFSNFGSIWGWATWRRAWRSYDVNMNLYPMIKKENYLANIILNNAELIDRLSAFDQTYSGLIDTWDYQWIFARLISRYLIILPKVSLIENIGFGPEATHTVDITNGLAQVESSEIPFPLVHPEHFCPDLKFESLLRDLKTYANKAKTPGILAKVENRLKLLGEKFRKYFFSS